MTSTRVTNKGVTRRNFLGLVAATGGATVLPVAGAAGPAFAAGAPATPVAHAASVGFAQGDLGITSGALGNWGDSVALAFDGDRRSIGADLNTAHPLSAIELIRQGEDGDPHQRLGVKIGVLTYDTDPTSSSFAHFNITATAALDYLSRSVGFDLQSERIVRRLQLHNRAATARAVAADYTLWASDDNAVWAPLTGWDFTAEVVDGRMQHTFDGFEVTARYVKINFDFPGTAGFDFILDSPLENARAFGSMPPPEPGPVHRITSRDLSVWVSDDNASWTKIPDVHIVNVGTSLWLYGFAVSTRYVKVHMHREDTGAETFLITDIQSGMRVYDIPTDAFVAAGGGAWTWVTPVLVSNPTAETLRDRAVFISAASLDVDGLVAAGRLQTDLRDLRFATTDGHELHAYSNGDGVYVRIPSIAPSEQQEILAYSGNPAASSRVAHDAGALQVEYGQRTLTPQTGIGNWGGSGMKVVQLPSGLMMAAAGYSGGPYQLAARFSSDGGRSWGAVEPITPVVDPPVTAVSPGGFLLDPVTDVLSIFFLIQTVYTSGGDLMDRAQNDVQLWTARTTGYDASGRPVFGPLQHIPLQVQASGLPVAWGLSYSNGIRTAAGTHLYPVSYMIDSTGTFASTVLRSTDGGASWAQSTELILPSAPVGYERGVTELAITELDSGDVLLVARQQDMSKHYFLSSTSADDGLSWSIPSDSKILSSNTAAALFRDESGGHGMTWPGHNGFGQVSYYRNNLTAAYSDDDGESWNGYQDLLAASSISTPGWGNVNETRTAVNADSWVGPDDGRVFAWGRPTQPTIVMHVDDYESFVRDSHGALDIPVYRSAGGASNGTELTSSRWWRTTRTGTVDLVEGSRPDRQAVRLLSSPLGPAGASRLFPAIRKGKICFGLQIANIVDEVHLVLQEGFSAHHNARGTALSLKITPSGELHITTDSVFAPIRAIGHRSADVDPALGNLTAMGTHQIVAYDYQNRSMGADLGSPREVTGLELVDNDFVSSTGNRIDPGLLEVWISDTNAGDWTPVSGWSGVKNGNVITVSGAPLTTRYIKLAHPYSDSGWTVGNDEQQMIRVLPDADEDQSFSALSTPTSLVAGTWHRFEIEADIPGDRIVVTVDGVERAAVSVLHPAEVLTHFLLLGGSAASGDVRIDEFLVQDTAQGLPVVARVGDTYEVGSTPPGSGGGTGSGGSGTGSGGGAAVGADAGAVTTFDRALAVTGAPAPNFGALAVIGAVGAALGGGILLLRNRNVGRQEESHPDSPTLE
ncbi:exo-alpha-sialidase [Salinibacterium sp. M195]|uniref:exo-alpha-sialidase n=1 Tax=Salinibacterium sp. M195 TaxID=2583374 RepID=UPI001C6348E4|nr:exo-alpha-sialidase [Salinibacterium sp. M195]QYH35282.1 hypothetical protein FFT87_04575 [Salinibacterium sp. M195]